MEFFNPTEDFKTLNLVWSDICLYAREEINIQRTLVLSETALNC